MFWEELWVCWKLKLGVIHSKWFFWDFLCLATASREKTELFFLLTKGRFLEHCRLFSEMFIPWSCILIFECMPWVCFVSSMLAQLANLKLRSECFIWQFCSPGWAVLCNLVYCQEPIPGCHSVCQCTQSWLLLVLNTCVRCKINL